MFPDAVHAALYFGVQAVRSGVSAGMIRRAARLLDGAPEALDAHIGRRLQATHGAPTDWRPWLSRQPLADRAGSERRQPAPAPGRRRRVEHRRTSGSTGAPFRFVRDREMTAWMDAGMWAVYDWHGIRPGQRHARFWGRPLDPGAARKQRLADRALARRRLGAFDLDRDSALGFRERLCRFRPRYAYGYPTLMSRFADHCEAAGVDASSLGLRVVVSTGELLTAAARARLASFFGCRVVDEYGCTESGILAMECEAGVPHAVPVAALPEVVDADGLWTGSGEVAVTDLYGRTGTLLRHRLHDIARWSPRAPCACGRTLAVLEVDTGRLDGFIRLPDGSSVYDAVLAYTVPATVARFRARQVALDRIEAEVIPRASVDPERAIEECRAAWAAQLGSQVRLELRAVDEIPLTAGGKLRYFVPLEDAAGTP